MEGVPVALCECCRPDIILEFTDRQFVLCSGNVRPWVETRIPSRDNFAVQASGISLS